MNELCSFSFLSFIWVIVKLSSSCLTVFLFSFVWFKGADELLSVRDIFCRAGDASVRIQHRRHQCSAACKLLGSIFYLTLQNVHNLGHVPVHSIWSSRVNLLLEYRTQQWEARRAETENFLFNRRLLRISLLKSGVRGTVKKSTPGRRTGCGPLPFRYLRLAEWSGAFPAVSSRIVLAGLWALLVCFLLTFFRSIFEVAINPYRSVRTNKSFWKVTESYPFRFVASILYFYAPMNRP